MSKKRKTPQRNPSATEGLRRIDKRGDYEVWMGPSGNAEFPVRAVLLRRGEIIAVTDSIGQVARQVAMSEFRAITKGAGPRAPRQEKKKRGSKERNPVSMRQIMRDAMK